MRELLKILAALFFLLAMYFVGPVIGPAVEWFMPRFFTGASWFCMLSVALIAYPISIMVGWPDKKLDIPDGK